MPGSVRLEDPDLFNQCLFFLPFRVLSFARIIISITIVFATLSCAVRPGSVRRLEDSQAHLIRNDTLVKGNGSATGSAQVLYLGSGGVLLMRNGMGVLVDPFFSHQSFGRIGRSIFLGKSGWRTLRPDKKMIDKGFAEITAAMADSVSLKALLVAHSHYDHLMDVPEIASRIGSNIPVFLNQTGFNICHQVLDSSRVSILENRMTTREVARDPFVLSHGDSLFIHVRPILADHNPHFRHVKFFSGYRDRPVDDLEYPLQKTRGNLWLEGSTFSFLIDFVKADGTIDYRVFIQSSSCNPPAGIPPALLLSRSVDLAILGVVSYHFSPEYPCPQLDELAPDEIIWIHWEDFFRKYTRKPKTVRGTNIPGFFKLPCVKEYRTTGKLMWPRTMIKFIY
jgi:hypothetical protein